MQDILDFINGGEVVSRLIKKRELEDLMKLGLKPISRDAFATCVLQEVGDEELVDRVNDDTSFAAVIPDISGRRVLFVKCEGGVPFYKVYCGDAIQTALKERYDVERSLPSIIYLL